MSKTKVNDGTGGYFLLLLFLLFLHVVRGVSGFREPERISSDEKVFVEVSGDIGHPGVYIFSPRHTLKDLLARFEARRPESRGIQHMEEIPLYSGLRVDLRNNGDETHIFRGEMSAFFKVVLSIPISLNCESKEGLTAIRGIGPRIADAIVRERFERGGFERVNEILSVRGIGPSLFRRIRPYLTL